MSYSVEAGPINFGSILPGQADEELSDAGPFLEKVTAADALLAKDAAEAIEAQGSPVLHDVIRQAEVTHPAASGINSGLTSQQPCAQPQLHANVSLQDFAHASTDARGEQAQHASCSGAATPPVSNSSLLPEAAASWDGGVGSLPGQLPAEHLPDAEVVHETAASPADQPAGNWKRLGPQGTALAVHEHGSLDTVGGCTPAEGPNLKQQTGCTDSSAGAASGISSTAPALAAAPEHASSLSNSMAVVRATSPG